MSEAAASPAWLRPTRAGLGIAVHVQPGAKRSEVVGVHGDALKLRLAAPPVAGRANECLLDFLAERLELPRQALCLTSGLTSRRKRIEVIGIAAADAIARLLPVR
jgi:uncharacterized protein (TIGR00251 family)